MVNSGYMWIRTCGYIMEQTIDKKIKNKHKGDRNESLSQPGRLTQAFLQAFFPVFVRFKVEPQAYRIESAWLFY